MACDESQTLNMKPLHDDQAPAAGVTQPRYLGSPRLIALILEGCGERQYASREQKSSPLCGAVRGSSTLLQEHRLEQVRGVDGVGRGHPELAASRSVVAVLGEHPGNQD
jgi:hypothetical protein